MPLLIVIPVRNEERRLGPGLDRLAESLQGQHCPDVLIVVSDNGSTDWTRAVAIDAAARIPYRVVYHRATDRADKGVAICSAWESAPEGYDVLAYCDADMATDPEALVRGYRLIAAGKADLVAGSRWHRESKVIGRSWKRSLISATLSFFWRMLPGARLTDPGCGLKLVRRSVFAALKMPAEARGFSFGAEAFVRLARAGARLVEIPVRWTDDDAGRIRLGKAAGDYARAWGRLVGKN
ncbi:MAG: glycosyltransferase family 2 protein [Verrucomicrobia bacterium]|nr:glycosyltransferase family 2 protein [Verrucomicrobiota bacterium]